MHLDSGKTPKGRRVWRRWALALLAILVIPALAACAGEYPQSTLDPHTDFGEVIHSLYVSVFWWTMFILAFVWVALGYTLWKFRERPDSPEPKKIHGHLGLEIGWTIGPAIIVVAIAIPSIQAVFATQRAPEGDALVVEVTGHRYWWRFNYPELGIETANELHLPAGRPVALRLGSDDVIHSFWVPMLGGKRDVNPVPEVPAGEEKKYNWLYFTVNEPGVFMGQCAEFCGDSHALMLMRVMVQEEDMFQAWVDSIRTPSPTAWPQAAAAGAGAEAAQAEAAGSGALAAADDAEGEVVEGEAAEVENAAMSATSPEQDSLIAAGRDVFFNQTYCTLCHAINGTPAAGPIGPNLTRFGSRTTLGAGLLENTPENLFRWIKDPNEVKPGVQMPAANRGVAYRGQQFPPTDLSDDQVRAVAAYLSSLK